MNDQVQVIMRDMESYGMVARCLCVQQAAAAQHERDECNHSMMHGLLGQRRYTRRLTHRAFQFFHYILRSFP